MSHGSTRALGTAFGVLLAIAVLFAAISVAAAPAPGPPQRVLPESEAVSATPTFEAERGGIRLWARLQPLARGRGPGELFEGDPVGVHLEISDTTTGAPLPGLYPAGWLDRIPDEDGETEGSCKRKIEKFLTGSILDQPEVDLNVYHVVALNEDATLSVVDPLFGFGNSKLLALVLLPSPGKDWALAPDRQHLYVSLPDSGAVAVVDTRIWKVIDQVATGGRPARLGLQPDGKYLWVGDDAGPGVMAIDTDALEVAARLGAGGAPHDFAFDAHSRFAFASSGEAGTLAVIDVDQLQASALVQVRGRPVSVAYSEAARAVYVSDADNGSISVVDGDSHRLVSRIEIGPGLGQVAFAPGGRLAFAVHPPEDQVHILDASSHRVVQTADVEAKPVEVAFSDELAYVRHAGSSTVLMIPLDEVGEEGELVPAIDFPGGQQPPGQAGLPTPAAGIVQAPGASAVLVANPGDGMIYYYREGMAAPMGSFRNYERQPRAVLVVDRSLEERSRGVYRTTATLGRPGRYDLAIFLDAPRLSECFRVDVAPSPELEKERRAALGARVEFLDREPEIRVGEPVTVRFRLLDPLTGEARENIEDVRVLSFLVPGTWQKREWAESEGDGIYSVTFAPPTAGIYRVLAQSRSQKLELRSSASLSLRAVATSKDVPNEKGQPTG